MSSSRRRSRCAWSSASTSPRTWAVWRRPRVGLGMRSVGPRAAVVGLGGRLGVGRGRRERRARGASRTAGAPPPGAGGGRGGRRLEQHRGAAPPARRPAAQQRRRRRLAGVVASAPASGFCGGLLARGSAWPGPSWPPSSRGRAPRVVGPSARRSGRRPGPRACRGPGAARRRTAVAAAFLAGVFFAAAFLAGAFLAAAFLAGAFFAAFFAGGASSVAGASCSAGVSTGASAGVSACGSAGVSAGVGVVGVSSAMCCSSARPLSRVRAVWMGRGPGASALGRRHKACHRYGDTLRTASLGTSRLACRGRHPHPGRGRTAVTGPAVPRPAWAASRSGDDLHPPCRPTERVGSRRERRRVDSGGAARRAGLATPNAEQAPVVDQ